jgi:hypothetical protein
LPAQALGFFGVAAVELHEPEPRRGFSLEAAATHLLRKLETLPEVLLGFLELAEIVVLRSDSEVTLCP